MDGSVYKIEIYGNIIDSTICECSVIVNQKINITQRSKIGL